MQLTCERSQNDETPNSHTRVKILHQRGFASVQLGKGAEDVH